MRDLKGVRPLVAFGAALLAGCSAVGPEFVPPETKTPASFAGVAEDGVTQARIEAQWWKLFNDPMLERLVAEAVAGNPDLRIASARLREARAQRRETGFDQYPTVTTSASYNDIRTPKVQRSLGSPAENDYYQVGFDAVWELDVWGRVRRTVEASDANVGAAVAGQRDVAVTLIAEVARNYLELRGAQKRLDVALRNAVNQQQTLNFTNYLLDGGRGNALDVARAEAQLNITLASIPPLQARISEAIHRLSVLTGRQPQALAASLEGAKPLPQPPETLVVDSPAEMLRRRPDIRVAEQNLAAETARVGVAVADLFPRVEFIGSLGLSAPGVGDLGQTGTTYWSIIPTLVWLPAFDYGRVRARIESAEARSEAALAAYDRVVLAALEETENALTVFGRERVRYQRLQKSETASTQAAELARVRFQEGIASFLEVLDAQRVQLEAQEQLAVSETAAATALVAVYKALGGGWEYAEQSAAPADGGSDARAHAVSSAAK